MSTRRKPSCRRVMAKAAICVLLCSCNQVVVDDPLYDIDKEQGHVDLQVWYMTHTPETSIDQLPVFYHVDMASYTEFPTWFSLADAQGLAPQAGIAHTYDTLYYRGYAQPGYYRFSTYADAQGYVVDTTSIEVAPDGEYIVRRPDALYSGSWIRQIHGGDVLTDTVVVRQRTREVVFRIVMALGDSIRYTSSDVRLTNVNYRLDLEHDAVDPDYQTPLPLQMTLEPYRAADGGVYPSLVDTINILTPTWREYAQWEMNNTLSVRINFAYALNGQERRIQPVDCSFACVLDEAYSQDYAELHSDPYCIDRYVWLAPEMVTFHTAVDALAGDIVPWDLVTEFGKLQ